MIHNETKVDRSEHPKPMWAVFLLLGILTLGIGVGLLLLQQYLSGVEIGPEHGADDPSNLHLLAFPLLLVAASFLLAAAKKGFASLSDAHSDDAERVAECGNARGGSRRLTLGVRLALLFHAPGRVQMGWAFFVGFAILFFMLGGPTAVVDLRPSKEQRVIGQVIKVEGLDHWQFTRQVYEYTFRYEREGRTRTGKAHTAGRRHNVGDSVEILVNPDRADAARIAGTRRQPVSWWVLAIPLGVLLLLPVGIIGNYIFNFRILNLARHGLITTATRQVDGESPRSANAPPVPTFRFQVDEQMYTVDRRSWVSGHAETIRVLYSPENPSRNVGLEGSRSSMLLGLANPWPLCLVGILVPAACIAALVWLWTTTS